MSVFGKSRSKLSICGHEVTISKPSGNAMIYFRSNIRRFDRQDAGPTNSRRLACRACRCADPGPAVILFGGYGPPYPGIPQIPLRLCGFVIERTCRTAPCTCAEATASHLRVFGRGVRGETFLQKSFSPHFSLPLLPASSFHSPFLPAPSLSAHSAVNLLALPRKSVDHPVTCASTT